MGTEELVRRLWFDAQTYAAAELGLNVGDKPPADVNIILRVVDAMILHRLAEFETSRRHSRRKRETKMAVKAEAQPERMARRAKPKPKALTDEHIKDAYRDKIPLLWRDRLWRVDSWNSAGHPPKIVAITLIALDERKPRRVALMPMHFDELEIAG